jgi:hypothetical protein
MIEQSILDEMVDGATAALLWSEMDEDGTPFDTEYDESDIAPESLAEFREAIEGMAQSMEEDTRTMLAHYGARIEWSAGLLWGHDFTLTSNGHGVGFWDRGETSGAADRLTETCRAASYSLYRGDDGRLYIF